MWRTLSLGVDICLTVTLLDGLVLPQSASNHSMNYRPAPRRSISPRRLDA